MASQIAAIVKSFAVPLKMTTKSRRAFLYARNHPHCPVVSSVLCCANHSVAFVSSQYMYFIAGNAPNADSHRSQRLLRPTLLTCSRLVPITKVRDGNLVLLVLANIQPQLVTLLKYVSLENLG